MRQVAPRLNLKNNPQGISPGTPRDRKDCSPLGQPKADNSRERFINILELSGAVFGLALLSGPISGTSDLGTGPSVLAEER